MQYKISQVDAEKLLNYLAGRPYGEVTSLISVLQAMQPVVESEPPVVEAINKKK